MFAIGLLAFFGAHLFTTLARGPRAALVKRLSPGGYKGLYSVVSLPGFALIILGWDTAPADALYVPPAYFRQLTFLFTALAMVLLVAAGLVQGKTLTCYRNVRFELEQGGGKWVDKQCVRDGKFITSQTWESHPEFYREIFNQLKEG